jgi:hypothetical protein
VGGAPDGVGPTLAQTRHEHVAGAGRDREERVIAPDAGIPVVGGALLGEAIRLADRRVEIDREGLGTGSGTRCPGPLEEQPTDPVELADVAPAEAARSSSIPRRVAVLLNAGCWIANANRPTEVSSLAVACRSGSIIGRYGFRFPDRRATLSTVEPHLRRLR